MQHVLLIGATSDVAKASAYLYANEGYHLTLAGRNVSYLQTLAHDIHVRYSAECRVKELDLLAFKTHDSFVSSFNKLPDITVCFAGYLGDQEQALKEWDEAARIINTNYVGVVSVINQLALKYMEARKGTIAVLSSVAGERGRQSNFIYGSAKAGLSAYLSGLRNRLTPYGIHVLTVKPGFIATRMTEDLNLPPVLTASPEKVAHAIKAAIKKRKNTVYVYKIWWLIMLVIKMIPESVFKKLKL